MNKARRRRGNIKAGGESTPSGGRRGRRRRSRETHASVKLKFWMCSPMFPLLQSDGFWASGRPREPNTCEAVADAMTGSETEGLKCRSRR
ncbi:hypothetical protein EVAR_4355_1 [Eumeta japonica]|uniref:Uncharacterized protein n=1 Tax=Eumeta variegata TaxID=151549 RepID=A0A4C1VCF5_EUMVA|nr:hypothetical protein EVAR_4355_1 [Eumeta japonica]